MRRNRLRFRFLATLAVLASTFAGASAIRAAVDTLPRGGSQMTMSASGSIAVTDSNGGGAILELAGLAPGGWGEGQVTIANTGSVPGALALAATETSEAPGSYGGDLSERLLLRIDDLTRGQQVYAGGLAAMSGLALGTLAPTESRTYRFVVQMLDAGAPSSPYTGDNLYQHATVSLAYRWTLTELEAEDPSPDSPDGTPSGSPDSTSSPASGEAPAGLPAAAGGVSERMKGTPAADRLSGTAGRDRIYGRGGDDLIRGRGGADRLRGGTGRDVLEGNAGADVIFGRDGEPDEIACGAGRDTAYVDTLDRTRGCETITPRYGRLFPNEGVASRRD